MDGLVQGWTTLSVHIMAVYIKAKNLKNVSKLQQTQMTEAQKKMQREARKAAQEAQDRAIMAKLVGYPAPLKEFLFHPIRKWRLDYAWEDLKIAIEVHGGNHSNGRHVRGNGFAEDRIKMNHAQLLGWIVIEITTDKLKMLPDFIEAAFKRREHERNETILDSTSPT